MNDLNPSMDGYFAVLFETNPKVQFEDGCTQPVRNFLWYNFQPHFVSEIDSIYFREKLGLNNDESRDMVNLWNTALSTGAVVNTKFDTIIEAGTSRFGVLDTDDRTSFIVVQGNHISFPHQLNIKGSGNRWCYLSGDMVLSDQVLYETFGLAPAEMALFREQW